MRIFDEEEMENERRQLESLRNEVNTASEPSSLLQTLKIMNFATLSFVRKYSGVFLVRRYDGSVGGRAFHRDYLDEIRAMGLAVDLVLRGTNLYSADTTHHTCDRF